MVFPAWLKKGVPNSPGEMGIELPAGNMNFVSPVMFAVVVI